MDNRERNLGGTSLGYPLIHVQNKVLFKKSALG